MGKQSRRRQEQHRKRVDGRTLPELPGVVLNQAQVEMLSLTGRAPSTYAPPLQSLPPRSAFARLLRESFRKEVLLKHENEEYRAFWG